MFAQVVDKFNDLKKANGGQNPLQTPDQEAFSYSMELMVRTRPFRVPRPPRRPRRLDAPHWRHKLHALRLGCYKVVMWDTSGLEQGTSFEFLVSFLILLNITLMSLYYWRRLEPGMALQVGGDAVEAWQCTPYYQSLEQANDVFTFLFTLELMLKVAAWGLGQYLADAWNKLDCVLVSQSFFSLWD